MNGRIQTDDLQRLVYNARIYAMKTSFTVGSTLWISGASSLRVVSSDDYIILTDRAPIEEGFAGYSIMSYDTLEVLYKFLDDHKEDYFGLGWLEWVTQPESQETLVEADKAVFEVEYYDTTPLDGFALLPQRLSKLRLVKPGDHPIDIKAFSSPSGPSPEVVGFKIGPTVQGLIAPLNRDQLISEGKGEGLWT